MYRKMQNPDIKVITEVNKATYDINLVLIRFGNLSKFTLLSNKTFFKINLNYYVSSDTKLKNFV
tara:strand:+ start:89 stop:280 length:192 start_codon:yes stop_codon:yes gene_type:complete